GSPCLQLASDGGAPAPRCPEVRTTAPSGSRPNPGVADEHLEGPAVAQSAPQRLEVTVLLHHTPDCRHGAAARLGDLLQLGVHVGVGGLDRLALGDRLHQEHTHDILLCPVPPLVYKLPM